MRRWYFKGERDGVYNWTAMPSIFPGGNKGMQNLTLTTNWQVIAHNRYAQRGIVHDTSRASSPHHVM